MGSDNGNWCLIESDPGVFTELIHNMGVSDVQVEELYSLDPSELRNMAPVYGLIFLFKYQGQQHHTRQATNHTSLDSPSDTTGVYFAQQIIPNACATQAILGILLNQGDALGLGETLENFRSFSADLPPDMRGLAMTNCDQIRDVHNSFVRPESFLADESAKRAATEDDDLFHFISYVPVNGRLYELDGLRESPVDHGRTDDWLESVGPVIQRRMAEYAEGEIRFNLMAVIGDRRKMLGERVSTIDASIGRLLKKLEAMNISPSSASTPAGGAGAVEDAEVARLRSQIGRLNVERADLEHL
ncbi:hypothetical protein GGF37_004703, partial [Kickxella alabastrina]